MVKIAIFILGIILLYFSINYILTRINNYYSKKVKPYDVNDKNIAGFGEWRNKVGLVTLIVICVIGLIILLINNYYQFLPI